jgi:hypothetical protein
VFSCITDVSYLNNFIIPIEKINSLSKYTMSNNTPPSSNPTPETPQEKIAKRVSTIVLIGTCVLGVLGMAMAIVNIATREPDEAKEILQILFSAILPLFGTWIGTILAYYYSKENLEAAT